MSEPRPVDQRALPVVWGALVVGCVIMAGVFTAIRRAGGFAGVQLPEVVQWLAAPAVLSLGVVRAVARRLPDPVPGWAVAEGFYLIGLVIWGLTGGPAPLVLSGVAFGLLVWDGPWRGSRG